jgi:hypothetical protein
LLVTDKVDDKGRPTGEQGFEIKYLPDKTQEYTVREVVLLGSVSAKPTLENGWNLTALDASADPKIPETINALVGAAKLGISPTASTRAKVGATTRPSGSLAPGLYRVVYDSSGQISRIAGPIAFDSSPASFLPVPPAISAPSN